MINSLKEKKPQLCEEWSAKNGFLPDNISYGSNKRVWWKGKCGHEWQATVKNRRNGAGCPYCSGNTVLEGFNDLGSLFPEIAKQWSNKNLPVTPDRITAHTNKKYWWKCKNGHQWQARVADRVDGSGCPYCSNMSVLPGFNDLRTRHPKLAREWSDKNLPLIPDKILYKSAKKVWWKCPECGFEWQREVRKRVNGSGCYVCNNIRIVEGYNDLATTDPEIVTEWDYELNKIAPTKVTRYSNRNVRWRCQYGHSWFGAIDKRVFDGLWCPFCQQEYYSLLPQLLAITYCKQIGMNYLLNSDSAIGVNLETYIPEVRLAIEYSLGQSELRKVKEDLCKKNNIIYIPIQKQKREEIAYIKAVKTAFRKAHIFLETDVEEDKKSVKNLFICIKNQLKSE